MGSTFHGHTETFSIKIDEAQDWNLMQIADLKCTKLLGFVASFKKVLIELIAMVENGRKKILCACSAGHNRSVLGCQR